MTPSAMAGPAALEAYLFVKMEVLCGDANARNHDDFDACRRIEELHLFEVTTPFERVAKALGDGTVSAPRMIADAPESLCVSVEHRYVLSRWPAFDFVIFESETGIAWGQRFVRHPGIIAPAIRQTTDLGRWSHLESEVIEALGEPEAQEGWFPWASAIYRVDKRAVALCYVYGLLQNVRSTMRTEL